ncbi:MAG: DUF3883 domain-containing protein [Planctomycetes bacterium]|nr:DUF3883 domain-containing protein [Planctomycetota bacterium]
MAFWVYKCNSRGWPHQRVQGDWNEVFASREPLEWGSTEYVADVGMAKTHDVILAYQTNRNELVGVAEVVRLRKRGDYRDLILKPIEELRVKVRPLKEASERIARIPALQPGPIRTLYEIAPSDADALLRAARAHHKVSVGSAVEDAESWASGGGFGSAAENRKVEMAAMREARRRLKREGWRIRDVSAQRCGYDRDCKRRGEVLHVEVKGVRGPEKRFILTRREAQTWKRDRHYCLFLVTNALTGRPAVAQYPGAWGLEQITQQPIAYACVVR